jgi:molybdopterin converting factor subunit 1
MTIRVQLFAVTREAAGTGNCSIDLKPGDTVVQLLDQLCSRYPAIGPHRLFLRVAVNRNYSALTSVLRDGDDVAVIPPMSGG